MIVLLPEQESQKKRDNYTGRPLICLWPRTSGLYPEIRQTWNQYPCSNHMSVVDEILVRNCVNRFENEEFPHLEENFKKENYNVWRRRARIWTGGERLLSVFGNALVKAWQWERGCMPGGMEASPLYGASVTTGGVTISPIFPDSHRQQSVLGLCLTAHSTHQSNKARDEGEKLAFGMGLENNCLEESCVPVLLYICIYKNQAFATAYIKKDMKLPIKRREDGKNSKTGYKI